MIVFPDLPGEFDVSASENPLTGTTALRVTQQLATHKVAGFVPVPTELLADSAVPVAELLERQLDRAFRPWAYPDRNPMPLFDPFPRVTALHRRLKRLRARLRRRKDYAYD